MRLFGISPFRHERIGTEDNSKQSEVSAYQFYLL